MCIFYKIINNVNIAQTNDDCTNNPSWNAQPCPGGDQTSQKAARKSAKMGKEMGSPGGMRIKGLSMGAKTNDRGKHTLLNIDTFLLY